MNKRYNGPNLVIQDFDQRHGGNFVEVDGFFYYATGGYRDTNPVGPLFERHPDAEERPRVVHKYWSARLRDAEAEFNAYRQHVMEQTHAVLNSQFGGPVMPKAEVEARLKVLAAEVKFARAGLTQAEADLEATRPAHTKRLNANAAASKQAAADLISAVEAIKV